MFFATALTQTPATISVSSGTVLSVKGSASVMVKGDVVNNGIISNANTSTWAFTGTNEKLGGSSQNVFGSLHFKFTGTLAVKNTLSISGDANFESGVVKMADGSSMFFGPDATSKAAETSYVMGVVQKKGVTDFTYPYGYNGRGKRVRISNITNGNSSTIFTVLYYRAAPPDSKALSAGLYELNMRDYYDIKPSGKESAMLEVEVDTADYAASVPLNTDALRLAHYTNKLWVSEGGFSNKVFDYGVKSNGNITSFSPFVLAATRPLVLAINKVALQGYVENNTTAVLNWKSGGTIDGVTAATLQRSIAGSSNWADVKDIRGSIQAGGYRDEGLDAGDYFYRLRILQNGSNELQSNVALVHISANAGIKVYPTLTHAEVNVTAGITQRIKMIEVIAANGAKVMQVQPAGNAHRLDLSRLAAGSYEVKIYTGQTSTVVRVVKY